MEAGHDLPTERVLANLYQKLERIMRIPEKNNDWLGEGKPQHRTQLLITWPPKHDFVL